MKTRSISAVLVLAGVAVLGALLDRPGAESGEPGDADRRRREVQHAAGLLDRAGQPARQDRQLRRRSPSTARDGWSCRRSTTHPRILLDNDKDGIYESEKIISDKVRNCQGLWFDGPALYGSCVLVEASAELAAKAPPAPAGRGGGGNAERQPAGRDRQAGGHQWRRCRRTRWKCWAWPAASRSTGRTRSGGGPTAAWR